jgi:glutathione synthase/RimK-type ligase-like ATP-grasp enzyme
MFKRILPNEFFGYFTYSKESCEVNLTSSGILEISPTKSDWWLSLSINHKYIPEEITTFKKIFLDIETSSNCNISFDDSMSIDIQKGKSTTPLYFTNTKIKKLIFKSNTLEKLSINKLLLYENKQEISNTKIGLITYPTTKNILRSNERDTTEINFTKHLKNSDIILVRPPAQEVKYKHFKRIKKILNLIDPSIPIINHIKHFYKHDCKELTFKIWQKHNLPIPTFTIINSTEDIKNFLNLYGTSILRLNNSWGGRNSFVINNEMEISNSYNNLLKNIDPERKYTKIIIVKKEINNIEIMNIGRSYVIFDEIINTHSFIFKQNDYKKLNGLSVDPTEFVLHQIINKNVTEQYKNEIILSVKSLGLDIGCVDYLVTPDNKIILLEVNAYWGMGVNNLQFPYSTKIRDYLINNYNELKNEIPNVYERMDEITLWNKIYKGIKNGTRTN